MVPHIYNNIFGWFNYQDLYHEIAHWVPDGGHIVEIGTFMGKSAAYMAVELHNTGKKARFDAIDPWINEHFTDVNDLGQLAYGSKGIQLRNGEPVYKTFLRNVFPVLPLFNPIKLPAAEACDLYADQSLDFVFIDGDHRYESVKQDIACWLPKVRKGGILAGHDYGHKGHVGVQKAVDEMFVKPQLVLQKGTVWRVVV